MHKRSKAANETITYSVNFARVLEIIWRPGVSVTLAEYVRPPIPNGFEYECTNAGQTAHDEPDWPTTIAETVNDGSVVWTARDFGVSASDSISTRETTPETGITVNSDSIDGTKVLVTVSGGVVGLVADIEVKVTTGLGEVYTETLRLTVIE